MALANKPPAHQTMGSVRRPGYEKAAEKIVEFITASGFKAGDRLPTERALSQQLGVSRTVVREAVKMLAALGIVRTHQGSGLYVKSEPHPFATAAIDVSLSVDPADVLSLFEFRRTLEVQTARLAAERITPRELRMVQESIELNKQSAESNQKEQFYQSDVAFHQCIAEATRNPFLASAVATVVRLQHWATTIAIGGPPGSLRVAADQHVAILAAIRDGQPDKAAQAMQTHLDTVMASYQQELRRRLIGGMPNE